MSRHFPQVGCSQQAATELHKQARALQPPNPARVSKKPKSNKNSVEWWGNSNSFGGSVDLGLLLRFLKGHEVWLAEEGELGLQSFATMGERENWSKQPFPVKKKALYRGPKM